MHDFKNLQCHKYIQPVNSCKPNSNVYVDVYLYWKYCSLCCKLSHSKLLFWDIEEQWRIRGDGWETSFEPYIEKKTHATNHLKPAVRKLSLNKTT